MVLKVASHYGKCHKCTAHAKTSFKEISLWTCLFILSEMLTFSVAFISSDIKVLQHLSQNKSNIDSLNRKIQH